MKAVYFSDFLKTCSEEHNFCQKIKEAAQLDTLISITSGHFLQNGCITKESIEMRVEKAMAAGVDAVITMSEYASLSSIGIYAYSACSLMNRLKCIDYLVLEADTSMEMIQKIVYLLISNTREFQEKVTKYKASGINFTKAQAKALGDYIPGAEAVMNNKINIFAVECIKSLKLMYSSIKCILISEAGMIKVDVNDANELVSNPRLDHLIHYRCYDRENKLSDIYGGYEALTKRIVENRESFISFEQFSLQLAGNDKEIEDIRKYLLRLIFDIKKSSVSIWRMYDFSPYCMIHTKNNEIKDGIAAYAKVPIISSDSKDSILERSKKELLENEKRIEDIYINLLS